MSNLQVIEQDTSDRWISNWKFETITVLCQMLDEALTIIREQSALLAMHGIERSDGRKAVSPETKLSCHGQDGTAQIGDLRRATLEEKRRALLKQAEREGWSP